MATPQEWKDIQYRTLGLTFSRCGIGKQRLLDHLMSLHYHPEKYYIVEEKHSEYVELGIPIPDGHVDVAQTHLHAWIYLNKRPKITNCRYFDVTVDDVVYHPHITKRKQGWIKNYLQKEDESPLTNMDTSYIDLARSGDYVGAREAFIEQHPKDYLVNRLRIEASLKHLGKRKRADHIYPLDQFTLRHVAPSIDDWNQKKHSLIIRGDPGIGKTQFVKSYCEFRGWTTFRVTHIDALKKYEDEDVLIFDDMEFGHLPRSAQIHLCDVEEDNDIHCRHTVAHIPRGTFRIFLCNLFNEQTQEPIMLFIEDEAIRRRCYELVCAGSLIKS